MSADPPVLGVIDVGTNTFHLLVARFNAAGGLQPLFRERRFVRLAERGIERIKPAAMERGLEAMRQFSHRLPAWEVARVRSVGTAALRVADNGAQFLDLVRRETGLGIETVSGEEEARLIHRGVSLAVPFDRQYRLIVDIGGGSVECLLANEAHVAWAASFPVGLAVLFHRFHRADPLPAADLEAMEAWLTDQMRPLDEALRRHPPVAMVGAAGTFDVLSDLLAAERQSAVSTRYALGQIEQLAHRWLPTTVAQRLAAPGIPDERADMFVLALLLVRHLARRAGLRDIIHSAYAMKEGILKEMAEGAG